MTSHPPLLAIVGPTAVGKTALALNLARALNGEIVSADSRQVYRGMDIGTAKPTRAEQAAIPHHLIDVVDPDQEFSLATYQDSAYAAIAGITARQRIPLLVGGTGQYLAAVLQGWQIPRIAPQPELRARLEAEALQLGPNALHARLAQIDPAAAQAILPGNLRRIIRALEVFEMTGQTISSQQTMTPPTYTIRVIQLTLPAEQLYAHIDSRVDQMISAGLIEEVQHLVTQGYAWELPAMSGLGYREFQPYLADQSSRDEAIQRLKYDTHAFARRQPAWFRRLPSITALPADRSNLFEQAYQLFTEGR